MTKRGRKVAADWEAKRIQRAVADLGCAAGNLEEAGLLDGVAMIRVIQSQARARGRDLARFAGWTEADLHVAGFIE